jgi:hypothetical protein
MTNYVGYEYPLPELYVQSLTTSLNDGLDRPVVYAPFEFSDLFPLYADVTHAGSTARINSNYTGQIIHTWADDLFGHIIAVPARLDMGNLLSNQVRTIEIANLFLDDRELDGITNNGGSGTSLLNVPAFPLTIPSFGSFVLQVSVAASGPPNINGHIDFDLDQGDISVPITGQRIIMFTWQPDIPITETLDWETNVLVSYDATEQRISTRIAARQIISFTTPIDESLQAATAQNTIFDWLARVWGVPIWWEQRRLKEIAQAGDLIIEVPTAYADFRIGGLLGIFAPDGGFEAFEIEAFDANTITLTSGLINTYSKRSVVMPVRTAYANTQPSKSRKNVKVETIDITFTTLDNEDLGSLTGQSIYDSKVYLNDPNINNDELPESFTRDVTVIDNGAGKLYQRSHFDRSRYRTRKQWYTHTAAQRWRVRRLLHALRGSQVSFFMPSFKPDFTVTQPIGSGAQSFTVENCGYTQFVQARKPFADVRFTFLDGRPEVVLAITGSSYNSVTNEETIVVNGAISGVTVQPEELDMVQLVSLLRIVDDKAVFTHSAAGESQVSINLVSCKE